ncbi:hypothetical protein JBO39_01470 [Serratia marcescens]|uniref:hypothetical protein n=1 Tax=Serratia marcescens TaxID=615 RepID=UPI00192C0527|nr:hypothetical protein [Serratia marcescens]MBL5819883.1 hypothetical protein [Serratia marcescens]
MDNKLSELSKPTACRNKHTGRTFNATKNTEPQIYESLYSQEYVSALLAELEAKNKRIAELETKLAKPVRLPETYSPDPWMGPDPSGTWLDKEDVKDSIRTAGFKVEGDE